jgi:phage baseplate assembly protein V
MSAGEDRRLAQLIRRLDMMLVRGELLGTSDTGGIQTMQVGLLEGEVTDGVERFQTYGISAVPPPGGDVLVGCVQGNRDQPMVIAVNDRGSRPRGLSSGEVCLYNDQDCYVRLTREGDVIITGARHVLIEGAEDVAITAGENLTISAGQSITIGAGQSITIGAGQSIALNAPQVTVNGVPIP